MERGLGQGSHGRMLPCSPSRARAGVWGCGLAFGLASGAWPLRVLGPALRRPRLLCSPRCRAGLARCGARLARRRLTGQQRSTKTSAHGTWLGSRLSITYAPLQPIACACGRVGPRLRVGLPLVLPRFRVLRLGSRAGGASRARCFRARIGAVQALRDAALDGAWFTRRRLLARHLSRTATRRRSTRRGERRWKMRILPGPHQRVLPRPQTRRRQTRRRQTRRRQPRRRQTRRRQPRRRRPRQRRPRRPRPRPHRPPGPSLRIAPISASLSNFRLPNYAAGPNLAHTHHDGPGVFWGK
jgi:hypothetical protein